MVRNIRTGAQPETAHTVTPSESIVSPATTVKSVTTAEGHVITLRTLSVLDNMKMTRALGPEDAKNESYMSWCQFAACIASYDGVHLPMPQTALEFEFVIKKIGDDGFHAVTDYTNALAREQVKQSGKKNKTPQDAFRDEVKN